MAFEFRKSVRWFRRSQGGRYAPPPSRMCDSPEPNGARVTVDHLAAWVEFLWKSWWSKNALTDGFHVKIGRLMSIHLKSGLRSRSRSRSRSQPESVVLTGVEVGIGVGKFSSTPTPAQSRSWLQHFFIISFLVKMERKMETEHYVLTADGHDGLSCTVFLALGCVCFRVN